MGEKRKLHVLVVDDEPSILLTTKLIARRTGWEITTTTDPIEALEIAKTIRPTVILSDFVMPRLTGAEFISALRSDPATENIPVVLMSGHSAAAREVAGASSVLEKPFSVEDLRFALEHAAEGSSATPAV